MRSLTHGSANVAITNTSCEVALPFGGLKKVQIQKLNHSSANTWNIKSYLFRFFFM